MLVNNRSIYYLRLFSDLMLLNAAFIISAVVSQSFDILIARNYMFILLAGLNFLWYFFSNVVNFYEEFNIRYFTFQFVNVIKSTVVQVIAAVFFIFIAKEDLFTRNFILIYTALLIIFIGARIQIFKYLLVYQKRKGKNLKNVLILGAGETGQRFYQMISEHKELGYKVSGFLDDEIESSSRINIIGKLDQLNDLLSEIEIELVIVALPAYQVEQLKQIIKTCNHHAVRIYIIPDYFRFISKKFRISMFGNFPIISVRDEPLSEAHWRFVKRSTDIVLSLLVSILILSWLIPLISFLNLFSSKGPVFFIQDRYGTNDKIFRCYKFRTMHDKKKYSEEFNPVVENDPRVTAVGKLLRRTNLDELPQFLNVLKGEMSVVGPRPHPIPFNNVYKSMVDEIKIRSWVKPGITGWAQIHGLRGDVTDPEENKIRTRKRIEYDIWYIENWSFWLDIQIILITVWQMLRAETKGI